MRFDLEVPHSLSLNLLLGRHSFLFKLTDVVIVDM